MKEQIKARIVNIRNVMKRAEAEGTAYFITNPVNVRYMSGFTGGEAQLIITESKTILITDFRYTEQANAETCGLYEIVRLTGALYELVKSISEENNIKALGIEENYISYKEYKGLKNTMGNAICLFGQNEEIEALRQVKDEEELNIMKKAAQIGDMAFDYIIRSIRPGMSENYVKNELEYKMKQLGASDVSFETIVASGKRSAMPHGTASDKVIEDGDIVTIDFGCKYQGYCSDMTRTFFAGNYKNRPETPELMKIYDIVNAAREMAINKARAGMTGKELDMIARRFIKEQGYGDYFGHGLGHGVGLMIHEPPNANTRNDKPLPAGAVITIEPGIYIEGTGGVRIEDMIVIKESGCELLTHTPRKAVFSYSIE